MADSQFPIPESGGARQQRVRRGHGEYGVVGESAVRSEQRELGGLESRALVDRADDVAGDGADHW